MNGMKKITSTLGYSYIREDYSGFERLDNSNNLYADINYELQRWLDVSFYVEYTDQDSTRENIIYDKNVVGVDFTFSL